MSSISVLNTLEMMLLIFLFVFIDFDDTVLRQDGLIHLKTQATFNIKDLVFTFSKIFLLWIKVVL